MVSKEGKNNRGHVEMLGGDGCVWPLAWGCAYVHNHGYAYVKSVHFSEYQFV